MTEMPYELRAAHMVFDDDEEPALPRVVRTAGARAATTDRTPTTRSSHARRTNVREHTLMTSMLDIARHTMRAAALLALLVAIACGDAAEGPIDPGEPTRPPVATVTVDPGTPALAVGEALELFAELKDGAGRTLLDREVAWSTSNAAVARVSTLGVVTAVPAGTATITATAEGKRGTATVQVAASTVALVRVAPLDVALSPGAQAPLQATAYDAANREVTGRPVTWTTVDPAVATVSAAGVVTAVGPGETQVRATIDGRSGAARVLVAASSVARMEVSPAALTLAMDEAQPLTATLYDAQGNPVTGHAVLWRSSDDQVVSVTLGGAVTALQPGTATITASAVGRSATATITVPAHAFTADLVYLGPNAAGSGPAQIWIAPMDGGTHVAIPLPGIYNFATIDDVAPSPDGSRIAFTANFSDPTAGRIRMDIWVVNRDGSGLRRLTTDFEANEEQPAWSPDGTRIAYRGTSGGTDSDIWVMNADGSNPLNLTAGESSEQMNEEWPAWSPDGTRIAYGALVRPTGHGEIWAMNAHGAGKQRLTSDTRVYDWEPAWAPDGSKLAFVRAGTGGSADIAILRVTGANPGAIETIPLAMSQLSPSWSPDGRYIAFASNHGGRFEVYTVRPDGRGLRKRTDSVVPGSFEPGWLRRQ